MSEEKTESLGKLVLPNVRLAFNALFEAEQYEGKGPFMYYATLLLPKKGELHKKVSAKMLQVAKAEFKDKAEAVLEAAKGDRQLRLLTDGDTKDYDGYAGMMAMRATRKQEKGRPAVLNKDKSPLVATDGKPYSGCFVNVSLELWAQNNKHGKCIRCTLMGVQFAKDGDAFGAGMATADPNDFEDLGDIGDEDDNDLVA